MGRAMKGSDLPAQQTRFRGETHMHGESGDGTIRPPVLDDGRRGIGREIGGPLDKSLGRGGDPAKADGVHDGLKRA